MIPWLAAVPVLGQILDKALSLIPDPNARAQAAAALQQTLASQDVQILLAQAEINKVEAASPSLFVSGGRPALMWVTVAGIAVANAMGFLVGPIVDLITTGHLPLLPYELLGWDVGTASALAGIRMGEKWRGVADGQSPASRQAAVVGAR